MIMHSPHAKDTYLYEMLQSLSSPTNFGIERFTGIVLGRFFCVTHHCSWDWERKYSCQKNTAIGIVKETKDGCDVRFFTTRGDLRPQWLVPVYLIFILISLVFTQTLKLAWYFIGIYSLAAILSAIIEPMTQPSKDGYNSLISLLKNPQNPYENLSGGIMLCTVTDIRGDYAYITYDASGVVSEVSLALLPSGVDVGDRLLFANYEFSKI